MESSNSINDFIQTLVEGQTTIFDLASKETEDGKSLRIEMGRREMQPEPPSEPVKSRSPARNHEFHDIDSFAIYVQENATEATVVLADAVRLQATCILNELSPDGFECVTYRPTYHPLLLKWTSGPWMAVDFAQLVIENRRTIIEDARDIAFLFRQLRTAKNIIVEKGKGKNSINGVMIEVKIGSSANSETQQAMVDLPESINVGCPLFLTDPEPQPLQFDLFVYSDKNDEVMVSATNGELESLISAQFIEGIKDAQQRISDVLFLFGEARTKNWPTVA